MLDKAKYLKQHCVGVNKFMSDFSDVQKLCDYVRTPIDVYDGLFTLKQSFKPTIKSNDKRTINKIMAKKPLNIMLKCNHYMPMFDRVEHGIPIMYDADKGPVESSDVDVDKIISKRFFNEKYHTKYASWDIEAAPDVNDNNYFKSYGCGFAWNTEHGMSEKYFWGLESITSFIDWLHDHMEQLDGYTVYAHNGGRFDYMLMMRECLNKTDKLKFKPGSVLELNGRIISFTLVNGKHKITFRDSCCIFQGSLADVTKDMKVQHQKLKETVDHDDITLQNWHTFPQLQEYLKHDVLGLLECIVEFSKNVFDATGINVSTCYTGATISKKNFYKNYYNKFKQPIYFLSKEKDQFIRRSYFGGRNECFKLGTQVTGKVYYYDFTSLYPAMGCNLLPYGKPEWVDGIHDDPSRSDGINIHDFFGFTEVYVRTKEDAFSRKPIHAVLENSKLLFKHFKTWTKLTLFSEEIEYGLSNDMYEYKFDDCKGIKFKQGCIMKKFFEDCFEKKAQAKQNGQSAMELTYKIIANSGYGFWGLRAFGRESIIIDHEDSPELFHHFNNGTLMDFDGIGNGMVSMKVLKNLEMQDFNVSIAAAITSYGRCKLWKVMDDIEYYINNKHGTNYKVFYCDTDSIITDCPMTQYDQLMGDYCPDETGDGLGFLKNECLAKIQKHNKKGNPVDISKQTDLDGGEICFDSFIGLGCKFYTVTKKCYNDEIIEMCKCKGYRESDGKLSYKTFKDIADGTNDCITQKQLQFSIPKSAMLSPERNFGVQKKYVPKKFKLTYNKGEVLEDGTIRPFVHSEKALL